MNNLEQFNQITVWVFAKLYTAFPNPIFLNWEDLQTDLEIKELALECFASTIEFLEREQFISVGSSVDNGSMFSFVVLTMKGLVILDSVPSSIKDDQNIGQQSQSIVKTGFKETSIEVVKTIVTEAIKAATFGR